MRRHAWLVFVLVALTGIVPGLALLAVPDLLDDLVAWFGHELPEGVAGTPAGGALARWVGTVLLGGNVLTLALAVGPFRRGERWAWGMLWYWPAMFASHVVIYAGSARAPQVLWALVTTVALVVAWPRTESPRGHAGGVWQDSHA